MKLHDLIPAEVLQDAIENKHVNATLHPEWDLVIYNYSAVAQFDRVWNEATSNSRGLIVAADNTIVARPFPKFQNYGDVRLPNHALGSPPVITDKLDGSLGIIYVHQGEVRVATRGSFASDQAIWATKWLQENHPDFVPPEGVTVLTEIIYPSNRIVVDYNGLEGLVLIAAIEIDSGADIPVWMIDWWPGLKVDVHHGINNIDEAHRFATGNDKATDEGVVAVWYRPGEVSFRVKIKHPDYVRLHRIITNCSTKIIWEALSRGNLTEILDNVPDEFYAWVKSTQVELIRQRNALENEVRMEFLRLVADVGTESRKKFADQAKRSPNSGFLFKLLDGKSIEDALWQQVKPEYSRPFVNQSEEL